MRRRVFGDRAAEFLKLYPGDTDEQAVRSAIDLRQRRVYRVQHLEVAGGASEDGRFAGVPVSLRTAGAAEQVSSGAIRVSLGRYRVCVWDAGYAAGRGVAAGGSQAERRDDELLDELCEDGRSERSGRAGVAEVSTRTIELIHLDSTITSGPEHGAGAV